MIRKYLERFKAFKCLVIVILMISMSAFAITQNVDPNNSLNADNDLVIVENETDTYATTSTSTAGSHSDQKPSDQDDGEYITQKLEVKKIEPGEIFEQFGISYNNPDDYTSGIESSSSVEPITVKHSDNPFEMVIPAEKGFYGSLPGSESSDDDDDDSTRGSRADAGDNAGDATLIKEGGNWTGDDVRSTYDPNNQEYTLVDEDWFYIRVQEKGNLETEYIEIKINNSAEAHATDPRMLFCSIYDPISIILTQSTYGIAGDNLDKNLQSDDDSGMSISFLDLEIFSPQENGTLNAAPPISGIFFIRIYCISRGYTVNYNITSITKTTIKPVVPPHDMNNYPENSTVIISENTIQSTILQHKDHWDWYDISGYIDPQGETWPNKISYDVDITRETMQANSFYSWTEIWVLYDRADGNNLYLNGGTMDEGGSPSITTSGGSPTEPVLNDLEMTGAHAWIGLRVYSIGINSGQMFPQRYDGSVDYTLDFDVELQNDKPYLNNLKIEPEQSVYYTYDEITFKVKYLDQDNNIPSFVNLTIDGFDYAMIGSGSDYTTGVTYQFSILCSELDDSYYPHTFYFSANDGLEEVSMALSSPNDEFKVIEDQTPEIWDTAPNRLTFDEDGEITIMELSQVFKDVDPSDGMAYSIKMGTNFGQKFESSRLEVFIYQKTNLKFQLKSDEHGSDEIVLRAEETLMRGGDTYKFTNTYKINITINSEEDLPLLEGITDRQGSQGVPIYFPIRASDPDISTDNDELSFSTNRSDGLGPDDLDGFKVIPDQYDTTKANISFTPSNEHVGKLYVRITVTDKDQLQDTQNMVIEILNVNDPPEIIGITKAGKTNDVMSDDSIHEISAIEDQWFNITVNVYDPDIAIGQNNDITFRIINFTFNNTVNLEFAGGNELTAKISVLPLNSDVGINYINFSVHDGKGGSDELTLKIDVKNVNDRPKIPKIIKPKERLFSIVDSVSFECIGDDEDLYIPDSKETLSITWYLNDKKLKTEGNRITLYFPEPFLPNDDTEIEEGNYTIKVIVVDADGEMVSDQIDIMLLADFDHDNLPDIWEERYDLDPHDRDDAFMDSDNDDVKNIDEYEGGSDPRNPDSTPGGKSSTSTGDSSWAIYVAIVVVVIIVLLLLFMFISKQRREKDELQDLDHLAYPTEEGSDMGLGKPPSKSNLPSDAGAGPVPGPGMGMGPGGMGMVPPMGAGLGPAPGPGMQPNPAMMQQMRAMQMQRFMQMQMMKKQQQGQGQGQQPQRSQSMQQAKGIGAGTGMGQGNELELTGPELTPKLPARTEGRTSSIDPSSNDDASEQVSEQNNNMKCPNCGISVQSGWFLCPGCKSPLN